VIEAKVHFVGVWHTIVVATTLALLVGGVVLEQWARAERSFLDKPDPQRAEAALEIMWFQYVSQARATEKED
jgi:hypothetical protein